MFRLYLYFITVVIFFSVEIEGACFRGRLQTSTTVDSSGNNVTRSFCAHLNQTRAVNTTWSYSYPDCMDCRCTPAGLSCCGFGINAGVFEPPEGCRLASKTCDVKLVKTSDPSKPCFDTNSTTAATITTTTTSTTTTTIATTTTTTTKRAREQATPSRKKCIRKNKIQE